MWILWLSNSLGCYMFILVLFRLFCDFFSRHFGHFWEYQLFWDFALFSRQVGHFGKNLTSLKAYLSQAVLNKLTVDSDHLEFHFPSGLLKKNWKWVLSTVNLHELTVDSTHFQFFFQNLSFFIKKEVFFQNHFLTLSGHCNAVISTTMTKIFLHK